MVSFLITYSIHSYISVYLFLFVSTCHNPCTFLIIHFCLYSHFLVHPFLFNSFLYLPPFHSLPLSLSISFLIKPSNNVRNLLKPSASISMILCKSHLNLTFNHFKATTNLSWFYGDRLVGVHDSTFVHSLTCCSFSLKEQQMAEVMKHSGDSSHQLSLLNEQLREKDRLVPCLPQLQLKLNSGFCFLLSLSLLFSCLLLFACLWNRDSMWHGTECLSPPPLLKF